MFENLFQSGLFHFGIRKSSFFKVVILFKIKKKKPTSLNIYLLTITRAYVYVRACVCVINSDEYSNKRTAMDRAKQRETTPTEVVWLSRVSICLLLHKVNITATRWLLVQQMLTRHYARSAHRKKKNGVVDDDQYYTIDDIELSSRASTSHCRWCRNNQPIGEKINCNTVDAETGRVCLCVA